MATTLVTKPLMTDETGQGLVTAVSRITAMRGKSAYDIYKEQTGYTGTEAEYAAMVTSNVEEVREKTEFVEQVYNTFITESIAPSPVSVFETALASGS